MLTSFLPFWGSGENLGDYTLSLTSSVPFEEYRSPPDLAQLTSSLSLSDGASEGSLPLSNQLPL